MSLSSRAVCCREVVEKVHDAMVHHGVDFKVGAVPESITKQDNGKLLVRASDGSEEEYDTVLCAVGRYADCSGLNLEAAGVQVDSRSGKIICVNEQTSVEHIYAIGELLFPSEVLLCSVRWCLLR